MTNTKPSKVFTNPKKRVAKMVNTYRAGRTLSINNVKRQPGELVPEAHTWLRVGNFTHTGYLKEVRVPESEFDEAVSRYCPDLKDRLDEKAKGKPVADTDDTKFTGFQFDAEGRVQDLSAQRRLERERKLADLAPNDRYAADHSVGTPADLDAKEPASDHSDGGPTVWSDKGPTAEEAKEGKLDTGLANTEDGDRVKDAKADEGDKALDSDTDLAQKDATDGDKAEGTNDVPKPEKY